MESDQAIPHLGSMLRDSVLWLSVFQITLESSKLETNETLHAVKNKYAHIRELFSEHRLKVSDAQKIESEVQEKESAFKMLLNLFHVNFENDKISVDKLAASLNLVKDALAFCEPILTSLHVCLSDFKDKEAELDTRKKRWSEYTVNDLLSEDFWLPFKNIRDNAQSLLSFKESIVFKNICSEVLETKTRSCSDIQMTTDDVVKLFSKQAKEQFFAETDKLLRGDDIRLGCMKKLFHGRLDSTEDLEKELKILGRLREVEINNSLIKKCKNFLGIKVLKDVIQPLLELMEFWKVTHNDNDSLWKHMQSLKQPSEIIDNWTIHDADRLSEVINKTIDCHDSHFRHIIEVLSESKELVSFLQEVIDEDIRNLIDAVDEHSEQYVHEATVSDLIEVHGCLKRLIKCMNCEFNKFLAEISELCNACVEPLLGRIKECSAHFHSLRALYLNVANRGEMTMEIINNVVKQGKFHFNAKGSSQCECQITMLYERQGQHLIYNKDDIHDLRSRALLLMNTVEDSANNANTQDKRGVLDAFIKHAELVIEICKLMNKLRQSGHFKYREFCKRIDNFEDLQGLNIRLKDELKIWTVSLENARRAHYYLNYFFGEQLWTLLDFFSKKTTDVPSSVLAMFKFVFSSFEFDCANNPIPELQLLSDPSDLIQIGSALQKIFQPFEEPKRELKSDSRILLRESVVRPGEVFIAALEDQSNESANAILSLYKSTTGLYPESNQMCFCTSRTRWEEVYLLLLRCFYAPLNERIGRLYCIANVEALDNEMQFMLVDALRELRIKTVQRDEENEGSLFLLALICRGRFADLIREQNLTKCYQVHGISDTEIADIFSSLQRSLCMVTSVAPGLGKSEFVYADAAARELRPTTVNICGPMTKADIMYKISSAPISKYSCLHLNIAQIDDKSALDDFLFQLLLTGAIAIGTQIYIMPSSFVYIEIASTKNNWLFDSLSITKYLTSYRCNLRWENYGRFVVSQEIGSPVQIVCHYLDVFDKGLLDTSEPISENTSPLASPRCSHLLQTYFPARGSSLSYYTVNTFLNVLSQQLKQMSSSTFFKVSNLPLMLGDKQHNIRSNLFQTLTDTSRAFASQAASQTGDKLRGSLTHEDTDVFINETKASSAFSASQFAQQMQCMRRWEDDNHLIVVFHAENSDSMTALYRDSSMIPAEVMSLFKLQKKNDDVPNELDKMSQNELLQKLTLIACEDHTVLSTDSSLRPSYVLTADNVLKMALIMLRVRAKVPVVIVGETGCGKTSLIRYLAQVCKVTLHVFTFHAGIKEEEILQFIENVIENAERNLGKHKTWIFLDEINTCDHIGLLSNIICCRKLGPVSLPPNLSLLAACNPYRVRNDRQILTAGLQVRNARAQKLLKDQYSCLVYRVNPLPSSLLTHIWDYGSLRAIDENAYIERMLHELGPSGKVKLMTDLIFASHEFLRQKENNSLCVSLRDVNRYRILFQWFQHSTKERSDLQEHVVQEAGKHEETDQQFDSTTRAIVLALAHCYQLRLSDSRERLDYQRKMVSIFKTFCTDVNKYPRPFPESCDQFDSIIRAEQEDYLHRMEIPESIAKNGALLENVFVLLTCILNRIPVFITGKPGSSKSLAMQLIRSNLRGRDSKDKYFRKLPQLYIVSYQGSESSTSDGIQKVFQKAMKYREHTERAEVLPVVLLDEIGLAEVSPHNPLKVLHGLLEPEKGSLPEVAVVGISNWVLDPAKMNRAIHLSRPEPNEDDLYQTGVSIFSAVCRKQAEHPVIHMYLRNIAATYLEYYTKQTFANFHGLRDYYSFVKCFASIISQIFISDKSEDDLKNMIRKSFARNFGGILRGPRTIGHLFIKKSFLKDSANKDLEDCEIPLMDLIKDNLKDRESRHLLLISKGDSAVGILKQILEDSTQEYVLIYGSRFEEDLSENYSYRILSSIILHMERPCVLILKDLDEIYGSLYDMLNKSYVQIGKKKNCRVALGPFSNPMCQVHDDFRCVVIVEEGEVPHSDPPFLNRFEKQMLRYSDVLNSDQKRAISKLRSWVESVSYLQDDTTVFNERSLFVGYHEETLPSLVLWHAKAYPSIDEEVLIERCKCNLLQIATTDGIMRLKRSVLGEKSPEEAEQIASAFFSMPIHSGLNYLLHKLLKEPETINLEPKAYLNGVQLLVLTHSSFYTGISDLKPEFSCQIEKLGTFKSEQQLTSKVKDFFTSSDEVFILQCYLKHDVENFLLAKSIIENQKMKYLQTLENAKHLCIVLHILRQEDKDASGLNAFHGNFLCGWTQVILDCIETPQIAICDLLSSSKMGLLSNAFTFKEFLSDHLLWAFSCLKYCEEQRSMEDICKLIEQSLACSHVVSLFCQITEEIIDCSETQANNLTWQESCAFSKQKLLTQRTFISVLKNHAFEMAKIPIAMLVYRIEQNSLWPDRNLGEESLSFWRSVVADPDVLKLHELLPPAGVKFYPVSCRLFDLRFPCSMVFINRMKGKKMLFKEETSSHLRDCDAEDLLDLIRDLPLKAEELIAKLSCLVSRTLPELVASSLPSEVKNDFFGDVIDVFTCHLQPHSPRQERTEVLEHFICSLFDDFEHKDFEWKVAGLYALIWNQEKLLLSLVSLVSVSKEHPSCKFYTGNFLENICHDYEEEVAEASKIEYLVVSSVTQAAFPLETVIHDFEDSERWQRYSSKILNMALKVDPSPPNFHFLWLCVDFFRILARKTDVKLDLLFSLAKLGIDNGENCMESETVLDFIMKARAAIEIQGDANILDELLGRYFGRCLDANPDNQLLPKIVRCLAHGDPPLGFSQMGPVVLRILTEEEESPPSVFKELILNPEKVFNIHPCLQIVENELKNGSPNALSDFKVICCDHIQKLSFGDIDVLDINSLDDPLAQLLMKALDIYSAVEAMGEQQFGLQFLTSVAFLRQFLLEVGRIVGEKQQQRSAERNLLFKELNVSLKLPEASSANKSILDHLQKHLIKSVKKWVPLYDAYWMISDVFPSFLERDDIRHLKKKTLFDWLAYVESRDDIETAITEFIERDSDTKLTEMLRNCMSFQSYLPLVAVLTNLFLKTQCHRKITDKEHQLAETIIGNIGSFPISLQSFIRRLVGIEEFHIDLLRWSQETDTLSLTKGSLFHHLISVLTCCGFTRSGTAPFMQRLLCEPGKIEGCLIPSCLINSNGDFYDIRQQDFRKVDKTVRACPKCSVIFICKKGMDDNDGKCFRCFSVAEENNSYRHHFTTVHSISKSQNETISKITTPCSGDNIDRFLTVRQLRPLAFRAINLLVHGCLAASIGSGCDTDQSLLSLLRIDSPKEAMKVCLDQFDENLRVLSTSLNCSVEDVCLRLHIIVYEGRMLLTTSDSITSENHCLEWENEMQNVVLPALFQQPLLTNDRFLFGLERNGIAAQLLETPLQIVNIPEKSIMRLLRTTQPATCENLKVYFFNLQKDVQRQYPFLSHVLANGDKLAYLQALCPLVEWAKFVRNILEHKVTRQQLRRLEISDFLDKMVDQNNVDQAKQMYKAFEDEWNNFHADIGLPELNKQCPLSWCLVVRDENPSHLNQFLLWLQEVQNKFLYETLLIASSTEGTVAKLLVDDNGLTSLPLTSIENLRSSEVIHFNWNDNYVKHSQCNTEYGKGNQVVYDLDKIEQKFAIYLIPGKAVFWSPKNSFRAMMFANELFGESGMMLKKIGKIVPQAELPTVIFKAIQATHEGASKPVRDLHADLELVLCCLIKTGGSPDDSLVSYIEKWPRKFGRQLKHDILNDHQQTLRLEHIVAFYEAIEDVSTDVDCLAGCYQQKIDDKSLRQIRSVKASDQPYSDETLLTALKRFISRYLMGNESNLLAEEPLKKHMIDTTFWPNCRDNREELVAMMPKLIPSQICLKHIHHFYEIISNRIKVRVIYLHLLRACVDVQKKSCIYNSLWYSCGSVNHAYHS